CSSEGAYMNRTSSFTPRFLTATEYVFALHVPSDLVAVLVRNRTQQQTMQRILPAETIVSAPFQSWLHEQNLSGADIFIGMNPVREGSRNRTKEHIREIRHAYLELDEEAGASLQQIRTSGDIPQPNFVLDTSPGKHQVVWRVEGFDTDQAESLLRALAHSTAATQPLPISLACFVCRDSPTENTTRRSSCAS